MKGKDGLQVVGRKRLGEMAAMPLALPPTPLEISQNSRLHNPPPPPSCIAA
jgi:hypothetical protein